MLSNLQTRSISSLIILPILAWAIFQGGMVIIGMMCVVAVIAVIEWRGATIPKGSDDFAKLVPMVFAAVIVVSFSIKGVIITWGLVIFAVLYMFASDLLYKLPWRWALGVGYICGAVVFFLWLRETHPQGLLTIIWMTAVVIAMDVGGLMFGKAIGGPKLWTRVSPKKTWSGFIGGLLLTMIAGAIFSLFTTGTFAVEVMCASVLVGTVSVSGDLGMSAVKRRFGVKDFSNVIPGHGGVLDRTDSHLAAIWFVGFMTLWRGVPIYVW